MNFTTWQGARARDPRRLVLGAAQRGMPYGITSRSDQPDDKALEAMLSRARDAGIREIDTAPGDGQSEQRIGEMIRAISSPDGWRFITKLAADAHQPGLETGETLERVAADLLRSRAALGQDTLPVLLLHHFAHRHACGGKLWRTLLAERDAGRIGSLGASASTPEEAWAALEDPDIEIIEVASSLLDLRLLRQEFFPRARELGRTVHVRSVFQQGIAHLDPDTLPPELGTLAGPLRQIRKAAAELGVAPRTLFLGFAREFLPGARPVVGCKTEAQLEELLTDWNDDRVDVAILAPLVGALTTLEVDAVDPPRWPAPKSSTETTNQTSPGSVATIAR